jgi:hypothetical protein
LVDTNIYKAHTASIFRTPFFSPEDGGSIFIRNAGTSTFGIKTQKTNIEMFTAAKTSNSLLNMTEIFNPVITSHISGQSKPFMYESIHVSTN